MVGCGKCSKLRFSHLLFGCSAGIFAYLNYLVPRDRKYVIETLIKGLQRLEYRGYDSAGRFFTPRRWPRTVVWK